jgi:hypothetical protein
MRRLDYAGPGTIVGLAKTKWFVTLSIVPLEHGMNPLFEPWLKLKESPDFRPLPQ